MMFCDKCNNLHSKSLTNLTKNNTMSYLTYVLKEQEWKRMNQLTNNKNHTRYNYKSF